MHVFSWNVGGLTPAVALRLLRDLRKERIHPLEAAFAVCLQEVIVDKGQTVFEHDDIQMVAGKLEEEWRGTAIAHTDDLWHTRAKLLKAGLSCVLHDDNIRFVVASGHLPHHSTVPEAKAILDSWLCFRSSRLGHEGHASDQSLRL